MTCSVAAVLADTAARRPGHSAVIHESEHVTYAWLWERARRYAAALRDSGVRPGDKVALLLPNTPEFPAVYFGVLTAGAVAVPLNTTLKAPEIGYVLGDAEVGFLVCAGSSLAAAREAAEPVGTTLLTVDTDGAGTVELEKAAERETPVDAPVAREPDDIAILLYTSGTTGSPKGVMLTHRNILQNVKVTAVAPFAFRSDDVLLGCLPLSHTFGQICAMLTCFYAGASMVLMPRFAAKEALALMVDHGCTVFMGVPTMYHGMLDAVAHGVPAPRLDRAYSGGSALPVTTLDEVRSVFGCPVYEGYGLTETSPVVAYNHPGIPCRPGTVGKPIEGVTVAIARPDAERDIEILPVGETGEIVVRGHNVMAGYLGRPDSTAEVLIDGWFRTGDLGLFDNDGYLSIVDRKKEMILRAGYNVYPREIEEVLVRHPAVAQVAVIGVAHPVLGQEVCAVVVPARSQDAGPALGDEIVAWGRERIAGYKYPRRVEFVDAFPLGSSGKVLKRVLASQFRPSDSLDERSGPSIRIS
ncbi:MULTISPECIES: long-chain fatty acid--CoA ligase [unclassified Streptomyces]|uniref:long-chain-fatty-acid--CoA ligase n=1 Tax=unclassified Streptomyces TaxID=2593676 RepID=UPI0036E2AD3C